MHLQVSLLGPFSTYRYSLRLDQKANARRTAAEKLYRDFAPEMAQMRLFQSGSKTPESFEVDKLLERWFLNCTTRLSKNLALTFPKDKEINIMRHGMIMLDRVLPHTTWETEILYDTFFEAMDKILQFSK